MKETTNEYKAINDKMGETVCLAVEKLGVSEYNTRSTCVDQKHVDALAKKIMERGFHPKRAISVNVIRGAGGDEVSYRVAAGIHRLEATKKAGLEKIPCLLYYDLTDEEECLLDKWDNEMDEDHKKIHFLEEAEHCKYLKEVKEWSQRQIAKTKGISRAKVRGKLKIASIPQGAKEIIRGGQYTAHFLETHFEEICKLSNPHIITICEEIAERGRLAEKKVKDKNGNLIQPMRQSEIERRVKKLLEKENKGKVDIAVKTPLPEQLELFPQDETTEKTLEEEYKLEYKETEKEPEQREPQPVEQPKPAREYDSAMAFRKNTKITRKMNLDRCVRWLKMSEVLQEYGNTFYIVLRKIEEYDLWYRPNADAPFFLAGDPFAMLAKQSGVEKEHIQKKVMPFLKKEQFLDYWQDNGVWWFKINWDTLFAVYCRKAYTIPFSEEGLMNIPDDFTGMIRPTPFHYIKIEKGEAVQTPEVFSSEDIPERTYDDLLIEELRRLNPPMSESEIKECLEKRCDTEIALKLFQEMDQKKRSEIKNEATYVMGMVRRGVRTPKGFVTPQAAQEREEQERMLKSFINEFREKQPRYFCGGNNKKYEITVVDGDNGFFYRKDDGSEPYGSFETWADMKYFK